MLLLTCVITFFNNVIFFKVVLQSKAIFKKIMKLNILFENDYNLLFCLVKKMKTGKISLNDFECLLSGEETCTLRVQL
jgi:hypothetical protein